MIVEVERPDDIFKICVHHGPLKADQINFSHHNGRQTMRCKACQKASHRKHYEKHADEIYLKTREYKLKNPERIRESNRKSWFKCKRRWTTEKRLKRPEYDKRYHEKNKEFIKLRKKAYRKRCEDKIRERRHKYLKKIRDNLSPVYVAQVLKREMNFKSVKEIPIDLIEIKRVMMKIKRIKIERSKLNGN